VLTKSPIGNSIDKLNKILLIVKNLYIIIF
jgi:hypothetical protein